MLRLLTEDIQTNEHTDTLRPCLILSYKTGGPDMLCLETKCTHIHTHTFLEVHTADRPTGTFVQTEQEQREQVVFDLTHLSKNEKRTIKWLYKRHLTFTFLFFLY